MNAKNIYTYIKRLLGSPLSLAVWVPLVLIVPNIALSVTEDVTWASAVANVLFPLGIFILLMGLWRRTGWMTWLMLPLMILAGFQIVLLYLYGGGVIAVDMFLNVVTTNVSEATELLGNLLAAMAVVIILYVPTLAWGVALGVKRKRLSSLARKGILLAGLTIASLGAIFSAVAATQVSYSMRHEIFPANAVSNMCEAVRRYKETAHQSDLNRDFTYSARATHPQDKRELYIMVIGETARGDNWQLAGYPRETNPHLSKEEGLTFFHRSISESNTTHKSVPMLMSGASAEEFDSIAHYKSILNAFKEAGFHTAFISNQRANRSFTEHFGNEADTVVYLTKGETGPAHFDHDALPLISKIAADTLHRKQLIVFHTYGSHFKYPDRYPREFAHFLPDDAVDASEANRSTLINAYDNTIRYTDNLLASIIDILRSTPARTGLVYASDHGEDIFDDSRERFLHASPIPTYWQIHQATILWLSPQLSAEEPGMVSALKANATKRVSPQKSLFPTLMQMAGVTSPYVVDSLSLVSPRYAPAPMVYLNDLNQALPTEKSGLKSVDIENLRRLLEE